MPNLLLEEDLTTLDELSSFPISCRACPQPQIHHGGQGQTTYNLQPATESGWTGLVQKLTLLVRSELEPEKESSSSYHSCRVAYPPDVLRTPRTIAVQTTPTSTATISRASRMASGMFSGPTLLVPKPLRERTRLGYLAVQHPYPG